MDSLRRLAAKHQVPLRELGTVGGECFALEGVLSVPLAELEDAWRGGLERALG